MKVLFVSPEVSPIVRTGGLGDVVGSLPIALQAMGIDVRILCPLHRQCKDMDVRFFRKKLGLELGAQTIPLRIGQTTLGKFDIPVYLVENDALFDRPEFMPMRKGLYGQLNQGLRTIQVGGLA